MMTHLCLCLVALRQSSSSSSSSSDSDSDGVGNAKIGKKKGTTKKAAATRHRLDVRTRNTKSGDDNFAAFTKKSLVDKGGRWYRGGGGLVVSEEEEEEVLEILLWIDSFGPALSWQWISAQSP